MLGRVIAVKADRLAIGWREVLNDVSRRVVSKPTPNERGILIWLKVPTSGFHLAVITPQGVNRFLLLGLSYLSHRIVSISCLV